MEKEKIFKYKKGLKAWPKEVINYIGKPKHHKPYETDCNCHSSNCKWTYCSSLTLQRQEASRELTGRAHNYSSWYRCKTHNKNIGGALKSQHLIGKACDCYIKGMPANHCTQKMFAEGLYKNGGKGWYNGFVHNDTSNPRLWDLRTNKKKCSDYKKYYIKKAEPLNPITKEEMQIQELNNKLNKYITISKELQNKNKELEEKNKTLIDHNKELLKRLEDKPPEDKPINETKQPAKSILELILKWFKKK